MPFLYVSSITEVGNRNTEKRPLHWSESYWKIHHKTMTQAPLQLQIPTMVSSNNNSVPTRERGQQHVVREGVLASATTTAVVTIEKGANFQAILIPSLKHLCSSSFKHLCSLESPPRHFLSPLQCLHKGRRWVLVKQQHMMAKRATLQIIPALLTHSF